MIVQIFNKAYVIFEKIDNFQELIKILLDLTVHDLSALKIIENSRKNEFNILRDVIKSLKEKIYSSDTQISRLITEAEKNNNIIINMLKQLKKHKINNKYNDNLYKKYAPDWLRKQENIKSNEDLFEYQKNKIEEISLENINLEYINIELSEQNDYLYQANMSSRNE